MQQKAVLKLDLHDEKDKKKAMKIVFGFAGIDSITMSMKDGKLTVKNEKKGNDQAKTNNGNKKGGGGARDKVLLAFFRQ